MNYDLCNNTNERPLLNVQLHAISELLTSKIIYLDGFIRESQTQNWQKIENFIGEIVDAHNEPKILACRTCKTHFKITPAHYGAITSCSCGNLLIVPSQAEWEAFKSKTQKLEFTNGGEHIKEGNISCPHCWINFSLAALHFQSKHPDLLGDKVLGASAQKVFLPTRYNAKGKPLDERLITCDRAACPRCHLPIPESVIDLPSSYYSFVGVPGSGKSYYLTLLNRYLRSYLKHHFSITYYESDPLMNSVLLEYDRVLSHIEDPDAIVMLPKTQQTGSNFSNQVLLNDLLIDLPKPFLFLLNNNHITPSVHRNIVLYDNAGEHFEIGSDHIQNPATMHLKNSEGILFLFDPSSDIKMRKCCDQLDPQVSEGLKINNQTAVLTEMIARLRRTQNLKVTEKCKTPLTIVVGKYDFWRKNLTLKCDENALAQIDKKTLQNRFDIAAVLENSFKVREVMLDYAPDFIHVAESFFETVICIASSNFGHIAQKDQTGRIGIQAAHINPIWITTPIITQFALHGYLPISDSNIPHYCQGQQLEKLEVIHHDDAIFFMLNKRRYTLPQLYMGYVIEVEGVYYQLGEDKRITSRLSTQKETQLDSFWDTEA